MLIIFSYAYLPPIYLLWWGIFRILTLFLLGCLLSYHWFINVPFIFWIQGLYKFCKYFFQTCVLSLHSLKSIFHRANIFNFMSNLLFLSFINNTFDVLKLSPKPRLSRFFPMLPSGKFVVLHFTFRSMIHLK